MSRRKNPEEARTVGLALKLLMNVGFEWNQLK